MGLVSPFLEDFKEELHELHYEWYKKARDNSIKLVRQAYDMEQARKAAVINAQVQATHAAEQSPVVPAPTPAACTNMGFEHDSEDDEVVVDTTPSVDLGPAEVPLIPKDAFLKTSVNQYKLYKKACRLLPWTTLYPDPK